MDRQYKLCFLGYGELTGIAKRSLAILNFPDTEVIVKNCCFDEVEQAVNEGLSESCSVFIAGSSNAVEFNRHSFRNLVELRTSVMDYLLAIRKALVISPRPVIITYRYGRPIPLSAIRELLDADVETRYYESRAELTDLISGLKDRVIIGASLACEIAAALGVNHVLIYPGEESVRQAIQNARMVAINQYNEAKQARIQSTILSEAPFGVIVTDENGTITMLNRSAHRILSLTEPQVLGQNLDEFIPALAQKKFLASGKAREDMHRVINGAMLHCIRSTIRLSGNNIGVVTMVYPGNSRSKENQLTQGNLTAAGKWSGVVAKSPAMFSSVALAKTYADTDEPLLITGEPGTGQNYIAQCIHNGSHRSQQPYVSLNVGTLFGRDAAAVLLGTEENDEIRPGLLELARDGTLVLNNLTMATPEVHLILRQTIQEGRYLRLGGTSYQPLTTRLITVIRDGEESRISEGLLQQLSVFRVQMPPLSRRREDLAELFEQYLQAANCAVSIKPQSRLSEILEFYSWPGNLHEMRSVAKRFAFQRNQLHKPTTATLVSLLIDSIGEDNIYQEILHRFPVLENINPESAVEIMDGINIMKYLLKYSDEQAAARLGISRTTLWRIKKAADAPAGE